MTMTPYELIDLLIIACSGLLIWLIAVTLTLWSERKELKKLRKSKDDLRDSMASYNYYLYEQLRSTERERRSAYIYLPPTEGATEARQLNTQGYDTKTKRGSEGVV